jgi:23S rRNA (uracil1939-C5)-methyltransferase
MLSFHDRLKIDRLGNRGEGIAQGRHGPIFVPYALPGETIVAETDGEAGKLVEVLEPSPDRVAPICRYFSECGGCAVQTLGFKAYAQWKEDLVAKALRHAGLAAEIAPLMDAHGEGRRRATFHARYDADGTPRVGFMQARSHRIIEIETCPLLAPAMSGALPAARAIAAALAPSQKPLDILVTATLTGLDIDVRGHGTLSDRQRQALAELALAHGLARLSNHGVNVLTKDAPRLAMGKAMVEPPPASFLQATEAGERILAEKICAMLGGAHKIADLFAGVGTFALRLAGFALVHAVDLEGEALAALSKAARGTKGLHPLTVERRDLFSRPLTAQEAECFDAILLDPPRAGALEESRVLAKSGVPLVVFVSCNAQTFARDAAVLCAGGYELTRVEPIDQFRHSPHVELVAAFRRLPAKTRRGRRLLELSPAKR